MPKKLGQKPNGLRKKRGPKEGPAWKHVMVRALSDRCQALYEKYVQKIKDAKVIGQELSEAVTGEWNTKFPDGIDGKVCAFRVANGDLTYVMKRIPKKKKARKAEQERGDDVFRDPLDGPSETVSSGDPNKPDPLLDIVTATMAEAEKTEKPNPRRPRIILSRKN
jgi:hypothetical protein